MTNEERCLKVMKISRYKEDISKEEKEISHSCFMTALGAIAIVGAILFTDHPIYNSLIENVLQAIGVINAALIPYRLKEVIESICKKVDLENRIKDIELELEFAQMTQGGRTL